MNYLLDPDFLTGKTKDARKALVKNKPDGRLEEVGAAAIYARLKTNIKRYRVYGPYWWALKDILRRQDYNVGAENDADMAAKYKGADDAETIVAADLFYLDMSDKVAVDNNSWTLDNRKPDYILYDADMEERDSITESLYHD